MLFNIKCHIQKFLKEGFSYKNFSRELAQSQFYSKEQLDQLQNIHLQRLIRHCYVNVPYYRELFKELGLTPYDITTREDLAKLPYLDKKTVKENSNKLKARNYPKSLCKKAKTSGTTGTPLELLRNYNSICFENAAIWRSWHNAGDIGYKRITLRGEIVVPSSQNKPPFWKYNRANNELLMSSYHLNRKNISDYIEKFKEFAPEIIYAYPSSLSLLAKLFQANDYKHNLKAIFTSSEQVGEELRAIVREVFDCEIIDWYGQAERVAAIGQCNCGSYHIIEDYSIVETIDIEEGTEIVGTGLYNYAMPLLRYRTGDLVVLDEGKCNCGNKFRKVAQIAGRETNSYKYYTENGEQILTFDHIPRGIENILETQIVQEKIDELIINVVPSVDFNEENKQQLVKNILERTHEGMKVIINEVDEIPRGKNGKFQAAVVNEELKLV